MLDGSHSFHVRDNLDGCTPDEKDKFIEFIIVNVTSLVKSSAAETYTNIISAIRVDQSYFDSRLQQIIKKKKRQNKRYTWVRDENAKDDTSEESESSINDEDSGEDLDHELFTVDSRSPPLDFERFVKLHKPRGTDQWFLFNHYSINPISIEEAVSTELSWRVPSVLMYMRKSVFQNAIDNQKHRQIQNVISNAVFQNDSNLARTMQHNPSSVSFIPLDLTVEMPKKGDIVAMDAEFVMLNHEETELRSDGTRNTIKPSNKSVARISCVRASGPMDGIPFIDDYITTQDQVADFMTKFSGIVRTSFVTEFNFEIVSTGIQPGDLDVTVSSKHLTTLKSTYLKLRFLLDKGVIFVGHGLRNDFRVINLVVPPEQVIDTVHLFQSRNWRRMVSLRFLAWHFLGLNIQSETHDSVEDAKTALALYRKYKELEKLGMTHAEIENLYQAGKDCGWKIADYS